MIYTTKISETGDMEDDGLFMVACSNRWRISGDEQSMAATKVATLFHRMTSAWLDSTCRFWFSIRQRLLSIWYLVHFYWGSIRAEVIQKGDVKTLQTPDWSERSATNTTTVISSYEPLNISQTLQIFSAVAMMVSYSDVVHYLQWD